MRVSREVAHRRVEGKTIIILPRAGEVIVLNPTGAVVWELSDGTRDVDQIAAELAERFDVSTDNARRDVEDLYRELTSAGALQPAS